MRLDMPRHVALTFGQRVKNRARRQFYCHELRLSAGVGHRLLLEIFTEPSAQLAGPAKRSKTQADS